MRRITTVTSVLVILAIAGESRGTEHPDEGTGLSVLSPFDSALRALDAGDIESAFAELHSHLRTHREDRELAVRFSRELGERGRHESRIDFLGTVLEYDPESYGAALEMGVLLKTYRRFEEATAYFEMIPEGSGGPYSLAQFNLASTYRVLGRFEAARASYQGLLTSDRYAQFASAGLCLVELSQGALDDCRQRLDALPTEERGGGVYFQADLLLAYLSDESERCARLIEAIRATRQEGVLASAVPILMAIESGDLDVAAALLEARQTVTLSGEHTALRAVLAAARGDQESARALYQEAITHNPLFERPRDAAAVLLWRAPIAELAEGLVSSEPEPTTVTNPAGEETRTRGCCGAAVAETAGLGASVFSFSILLLGVIRRWTREC